MKITSLYFFIFLLLPGTVFSQNSLVEKYKESYSNLRTRNGVDLKGINRVIDIAKDLADYHRLRYKEITLYDRKNNSYPGLQFLEDSFSFVGKEVQDLNRNFGEIKLVLSPYDLKRSGANAFFKPDGTMIGAPLEVAFNKLNESYFHEKMHADTYRKLLINNDDLFIGYYKLVKGERMGHENHEGYFRHASIDEMNTTEFSVKESMKKLYNIYKTTNKETFLKDKTNEELLGEVLFSLKNLIGLAKQSREVLDKAKVKLKNNQMDIKRTTLRLGDNLSRSIFEITLKVSSVERVFQNGRGENREVLDGTLINLKSFTTDKEYLLKRVEKIQTKANFIASKYPQALKLVGTRIFYADLKSTNIPLLYNAIIK